MSDNEDLLGDDLGDQSLADYNLGNEEEEQLLADDYESTTSQNVPSSISSYDGVSNIYSANDVPTPRPQPIQYHLQPDRGGECVVPNITVEVPNILPEHSTYAPYEPPPVFEAEPRIVPPAIPAGPIESPQIVPSDIGTPLPDESHRVRFVSERPIGAQRQPQVRDIPDSLDKVFVPRGQLGGRGRGSWRNTHFNQRFNHNQYRRNNMHRGNFNQRSSFPPPQVIRQNAPQIRPEIRINPPMRPEIRPDIRPEIIPEIRPVINPEIRPDIPPIRPELPPLRPEIHPEIRPDLRPEMPPEILEPLPAKIMENLPERSMPNIPMEPFRNFPRFPNQFRPNMDPRFGPPMRPNFDPRFPFERPYRPFIRESGPGPVPSHIPQVTIRQPGPMAGPVAREAEVRMLPVQLPPHLPPGGLQGKKVLINPHFKGNFQNPVEGPIKDIDDAAERFIAEQRNALARAASRKTLPPPPRRSPTRYIENTTIEIENELAPRRGNDDDELLRRQEEFINANRAGLRRRMRSPSVSPPRRSLSPSPRRSPPRSRPRVDRIDRNDRAERIERIDRPHDDEESEYRRRMREQESLRERVLRAKEARRRKNAVANRERERTEKEKEKELPREPKEEPPAPPKAAASPEQAKPDTTRTSPERERERDRSPINNEEPEVNSTCENLTPPASPPRPSPVALTPPLPTTVTTAAITQTSQTAATAQTSPSSDDDLDLILGDIDGILSDDDDTGRFKQKQDKPEPVKSKPQSDLRSKLPPKQQTTTSVTDNKKPKQRIIFEEKKEDKKKKDKSPPRRTVVTSSTKAEVAEAKVVRAKEKQEARETRDIKQRQRITFNKEARDTQEKEDPKPQFSNRRVILQRKVQNEKITRIEVKTDPSQPNPGIFSRAVRTAIGTEKTRIVVNKKHEPQIEYDSDSSIDEDTLLEDVGNVALVTNLPHGMTDTRLKTLAGNDVQSLNLDREERSAKITFKTTVAAENFKKKFNNKMVAASRLTVSLR